MPFEASSIIPYTLHLSTKAVEGSLGQLKMQFMNRIHYTFHHVQNNSPHVPLAVSPVVALKSTQVFMHSPGSANGKQIEWLGPSHTLS